jgi:predicted metal-dependent phosphoesterase TrpH
VTPRVDLHLHTTASDGRCTPAELVDRAAHARLNVIAVTDHDTTNAVAETQSLGRARGIDVVAGIEITSMENGRDMHVLGYFFDPSNADLAAFLDTQRRNRVARVEAIGARLAVLGVPIDTEPLLDMARRDSGRSIGRPQIARAMIAAGYVNDTREAFDKWLQHGAPAFVPREGPRPAATIAIIQQAGGIASIAHPGADDCWALVQPLAQSGLDAVEAYHSDHDAAMVEQYLDIARQFNLLVTGGSDFHGDPAHGLDPGSVTLPPPEWERLQTVRYRHRR